MIGFDPYTVAAWQVDGLVVHIPNEARRSPRRRAKRSGSHITAMLTAGLFTLGMSTVSVSAGAANVTAAVFSSVAQAGPSEAYRDLVPLGYWSALQSAMKRAPELPELPAHVEIEPYV